MFNTVNAAPAFCMFCKIQDSFISVLPGFGYHNRKKRQLFGSGKCFNNILYSFIIIGVHHLKKHEGKLESFRVIGFDDNIGRKLKHCFGIDASDVIIDPPLKFLDQRKHADFGG